ncbi:predicted protein [Uncinocarpus reesii 1704]|uniref:Uncharacterized protein n=1 Tax=Uncinocarpus reesii (strain UAMH 1704) TaxID=336963 RepID=C4JJ77_UNCRE|nr:uncharacterized protein UREG_01684 [Uncinocarpus reesii 1704]EEP76835.1 predicted protein [Uncinocarpus reesii 1704]
MSIPIHTTRRVSLPCGDIIVTAGTEDHRAVLPPNVSSLKILGSVSDYYQMAAYQSNGRSSILDGKPFFTFGETIQKGHNGEFIGVIPNTSAPVVYREANPIEVTHMPEGVPAPLVELTDTERSFERESGYNIILQPEGGICEATPPGHGWTWYKKYIEQQNIDGTMTRIYYGTGIAPVKIEQTTGQLVSRRVVHGQLLFDRQQPGFGTFCAVRDGTWYYLWGQLGEHIYLARVGIWYAIQRELYEFWNGYTFTHDMDAMVPVLAGYSSGSFFRTDLFGHRYSWASSERFPRKSLAFLSAAEAVIGANLQFDMLHQGGFWKDICLSELPAVLLGRVRSRTALIEAMAQLAEVHQMANDGGITIRLVGTTRESLDQATKNIRELIVNLYRELRKEEGFNARDMGFERRSLGFNFRRRARDAMRRVFRRSARRYDEEDY